MRPHPRDTAAENVPEFFGAMSQSSCALKGHRLMMTNGLYLSDRIFHHIQPPQAKIRVHIDNLLDLSRHMASPTIPEPQVFLLMNRREKTAHGS